MKLMQAVKMALKAIAGNKMRSFLTMLGIIIGVLSVVLLTSLGESMTSEVTGQISSLGSNLITVQNRAARQIQLTLDDLEGLRGKNGVENVSPEITSTLTLKSGTNTYDATVQGVTEGYDVIRGYNVQSGRFITSTDVAQRSYVCVIGVTVADELFGQRNVVGETIRIDGKQYTIVGLYEETGASLGMSQDERATIPFTTAQRNFRNTTIGVFYADATNEDTVDQAVKALEAFMYKKTNDVDAYSVTSMDQLLETVSNITGTLTTFLAAIAAISLLVGGIGIMNIMLVSVSERTREIGIRKAIGAQRLDIMSQFIIEAVMISVSGGVIALVLAWLSCMFIGPMLGITMTMSGGTTLLALGFSVAMGVLFGTYPANKASQLTPIEALRYE